MVRSAFWSSWSRLGAQTGTRGKDLGGFKLSLRHPLELLLHSTAKIPEKGVGRPNLLLYTHLLLSRGRVLESHDRRRLLHLCPLADQGKQISMHSFTCLAHSNLTDLELQMTPMVSGFNSFLDFYSVKGRKQKTPCWMSALPNFSRVIFVQYLKKMWFHTAKPIWKSTHGVSAPSIPWQKCCILTAVCQVPHCCYKWPVLALSLLMHFLTAQKDSWLTEPFSTWLSSLWIKHCNMKLILYQTGSGLNSDLV